MGSIDLRPLEFEWGRYVMQEIISNDPELSHLQRGMLNIIANEPQRLFRGDDHVGNENTPTFRRWMYDTLSRAPQTLFDSFTALQSSVRRFGTWESMTLTLPPDGEKASERLEYGGDLARGWKKTVKGWAEVVPIDGAFIEKIFDGMRFDPRWPDIETMGILDRDKGNILWDVKSTPDKLPRSSFSERLQAMPSFGAQFLDIGRNEIRIYMDRFDPAFDPFEAYARQVKIGKARMEVDIRRDVRPADEPLLYEFTPAAERLSSLPQGEALWRVEARVGEGIDPAQFMYIARTMNRPALQSFGPLPAWKRDPSHIFLQGARSLYDLRGEADPEFERGEIVPGNTIGILGTGKHAPEVLANLARLGEGVSSTGGGASSTICSITNVPRMTGMNPGITAMNSGMMAARMRAFR